MVKERKSIAKEWIKKGRHDLEALALILKNSGPADVAGVLLQQALEKYLKGYLIVQGWKLLKTHDLKHLLDEAITHDKRFERFYDLSDILTNYYFEEKYPFGKTEITLKEITSKLKESKEIIEIIDSLID